MIASDEHVRLALRAAYASKVPEPEIDRVLALATTEPLDALSARLLAARLFSLARRHGGELHQFVR